MTPHYSEYYDDQNKPPADYYSPVPIYFIAVAPKRKFCFAIAHREPNRADAENDIKKGFELLREALSNIGAGGKTAVGYGFFLDANNKNEAPKTQAVTEDWKGVIATYSPGNGVLTANYNGKAAIVKDDKAKEIKEQLGKSNKKNEFKNVDIVVEIMGNQYTIKGVIPKEEGGN